MVVKKEEGDANGHELLLLTKPGQKYPTPTPGVAERIFYETLYQQNEKRYVGPPHARVDCCPVTRTTCISTRAQRSPHTDTRSAMAQEWCVAYGILEDAEAAKVLKVSQPSVSSGISLKCLPRLPP